MKVAITGAAGFVGRKLTAKLLERGSLTGRSGEPEAIDQLVLFDTVAAPAIDNPRVRVETGDITDADRINQVIGDDTDSIFHLAAVVSAASEADFDLGFRVNLDGTRHVLEL